MERMDLYIAGVVTLMFLAGCFLAILAARERSRARFRLEGSPVAKTTQSAR